MAEKKHDSGFTVTDRRLFTPEGELRKDVAEEAPQPAQQDAVEKKAAGPQATGTPPTPSAAGPQDTGMPPTPSAAEQQAQADAYRKSSQDMDARVELSGHSAKDLEMTLERFLASIYMSAMLQLGLMQEEGGQPRIDLVGARQTIDTLDLLSEKTKGNLTSAEENFLQNCLYELRMAYVEVTNALARPPQTPPATGTNAR